MKYYILNNIKYIFLFISICLLISCKSTKYVPIEKTTTIQTIDSIIYRIDTIFVDIPIEKEKSYTDITDTLILETSTAISKTYIDTINNKLSGEIKSKNNKIKVPVKEKTIIQIKDSLVYQDVPYEVIVEKPYRDRFFWYLFAWFLLSLISLGVYFRNLV